MYGCRKHVGWYVALLILFCALMVCGISGLSSLSAQSLPDEAAVSGYDEEFSILWIGKFSSSEDLKKGTGIVARFGNLLFGRKKEQLVRPISLLAESPTRFWVLDQGSQKLVWIDEESGEMKSIRPEGNDGYPSLIGICERRKGEILFTDSGLDQIFLLKGHSAKPRILNDHLMMQRPTGIAYSSATDEIWVAETGAHCLSVLDEDGSFLKRIGARGTGPGEFNFPTFLWIDRSGVVYVVDSLNFRVQIFDREGKVLHVFGESGDATGYFGRPKGIATDSHGNIYVADALFHTVQVFDRKGNFLLNFGTQGRGDGEFWLPAGIYIDAENRIYVADGYNARVQIFQLVRGGER